MSKRTEASSREFHAIERLAVLDSTLDKNGGYLEARLRSVPDLYRQYRIAQTATSKVVAGLYDTLPINNLERLEKESKRCEVVVRPISRINKSTDTTFMLNNDILTLVNTAIDSTCSICMKTCKEVKECELRRAFMNVIPLETLETGSMCGYAKIASGLASDEDYI